MLTVLYIDFMDSAKALYIINIYIYIFVLLCLQADSGFFCEGYSSDEDVLLKEEFRGNIIKQGCLVKQVNQKTRKMFPASLLQHILLES